MIRFITVMMIINLIITQIQIRKMKLMMMRLLLSTLKRMKKKNTKRVKRKKQKRELLKKESIVLINANQVVLSARIAVVAIWIVIQLNASVLAVTMDQMMKKTILILVVGQIKNMAEKVHNLMKPRKGTRIYQKMQLYWILSIS